MSLTSKSGFRLIAVCVATLAFLAGCGSLGPKTMHRDQLNYGTSIGDNWKNQMLSNIVKLRYVDMPVFVDVGSIVSGYSLSTTVNGRLGFGDGFTSGNTQGLGAGGTYTDRPTITYMPKTGDAYLKAILEPVSPRKLLSLVQAGYSAELLFTWSVAAINGIHNWSTSAKGTNSANPEFVEFVKLMQELQTLGAVGFELERDTSDKHDIVLVLNKAGLPETTQQKSDRIGELLGLDPGQVRYRVMYAPFKIDDKTLAMQTRSVVQMMGAMAGFVDVPAEQASNAARGFDLDKTSGLPFHVRSGPDRPEQSFAEVKYQDYWYWIENSDISSKRVFTLMLFITTLTNQATDENAPVLTIPTQ